MICAKQLLRSLSVIACTILGIAPAAAATAERLPEIRVAETLYMAAAALPGPGDASHQLRVYLYGFRGMRWTPAEIFDAALGSARLLAQCGVSVAAIELRLLETPRHFHFYSTAVSRALVREIAVAKPAVFFVDDTLNRPAFDAEAIGRHNAAFRPELADTIWVAYGARDPAHALAHELVHVLSDSGEHSDEPGNLMRPDTSGQNVNLSAAQCDRLRSRGEALGLLVRR